MAFFGSLFTGISKVASTIGGFKGTGSFLAGLSSLFGAAVSLRNKKAPAISTPAPTASAKAPLTESEETPAKPKKPRRKAQILALKRTGTASKANIGNRKVLQ